MPYRVDEKSYVMANYIWEWVEDKQRVQEVKVDNPNQRMPEAPRKVVHAAAPIGPPPPVIFEGAVPEMPAFPDNSDDEENVPRVVNPKVRLEKTKKG